MMALVLLVGGTAFFALHVGLGQSAVVAAAVALGLIVVADAVLDTWRNGRDRRQAYDRLREMRSNDALNRIGGPRRG